VILVRTKSGAEATAVQTLREFRGTNRFRKCWRKGGRSTGRTESQRARGRRWG
jgi:hypothetical protein